MCLSKSESKKEANDRKFDWHTLAAGSILKLWYGLGRTLLYAHSEQLGKDEESRDAAIAY